MVFFSGKAVEGLNPFRALISAVLEGNCGSGIRIWMNQCGFDEMVDNFCFFFGWIGQLFF